MKKTLTYIASLLIVGIASSNASVTFSGTALLNTPGLADGQVGVMLNDDDASGFSALSGNIQPGLSLSDSATFSGAWGNFTVLATNTVSTGFGSTSLGGGAGPFNLTGGVSQGDSFAYLVFNTSTTNTIASDSIGIWNSGDWIVPADGALSEFGTGKQFTQQGSGSSPASTISVVPEPSTYLLMALGGLFLVVFARRRKAQA
jgi:hypothetical protein